MFLPKIIQRIQFTYIYEQISHKKKRIHFSYIKRIKKLYNLNQRINKASGEDWMLKAIVGIFKYTWIYFSDILYIADNYFTI